jgi:nicotinate phosphoribosyltransferase
METIASAREPWIYRNAERQAKTHALSRFFTFPQVSLEEFEDLPASFKSELLSRNRIINTDTYNRTMAELLRTRVGEGAFTLQMRRSPFNYIVVCGIQELLDELLSIRISREELSFAAEYYRHSKNPFFDPQMWEEVIAKHQGQLPFEIHGVRDGTVVLPGEPILTVIGDTELIAHFEQLFHRVFYASMVATRAHALKEKLGDSSRFIEVGKRAAVTDKQHYLALRAMKVGGGFYLTSDDAGSGLYGMTDAGTIGHRYVQCFESEEDAFRHAIRKLHAVTLLIDLVESVQGIDLALKLKDEYRHENKKIWVRLDSGDILAQARYYLQETNKRGLTDPERDKLVVEGLDSLEEIFTIEAMIEHEFGAAAKKRVMYGAGGLLISEKTSRSDASTGFKISAYRDAQGVMRPTMKFSNSPGKRSFPGCPRLASVDGTRIVAQLGERLEGRVRELFVPLYLNGVRYWERDNDQDIHHRVLADYRELFGAYSPTPDLSAKLMAAPSPVTREKIEQIRVRYGIKAPLP